MPDPVTLTGRLICADAAEAATVRDHLPRHAALTRAEPGNLRFEVVPDGPLEWRVDEAFTDAEAFRHHQARAAASDWGRATARIRRDYRVEGL